MGSDVALTARAERELGSSAFSTPLPFSWVAKRPASGNLPHTTTTEAAKFPRVTRFEQISANPRVVEALRRVYGHVDNIEYFVGIFAEETPPRLAVTPMIMRMVAVDAFSHLLTNPLLAPSVYNSRATFSDEGWEMIQKTSTLKDLLERNVPHSQGCYKVTMELNGVKVFA
jgi:prostaglandin-endoperoxide synthase 2